MSFVNLKKYLIILSLLLSPLIIFFIWLASTQSGLQFIVDQTKSFKPKNITYEKITGSLISGINIDQLRYHNNDLTVSIDKISIKSNLTDLLFATLSINKLQMNNLKITLNDNNNKNTVKPRTQISLPQVYLPWRINLELIEVDDFILVQTNKTTKLKKINLVANFFANNITIKQLEVASDDFKINLTGKIKTNSHYSHELKVNWSLASQNSETTIKKHFFGSGFIEGDVQHSVIKQQLRGDINARLSLTIDDLLTTLRWRGEVSLDNFNSTTLTTNWPEISGKLQFSAKGDLSSAKLTGKAKIKHPKYGLVESQFNLTALNYNHIQIDAITLKIPDSNSLVTLRGDWHASKSITGDIALALQWKNLRWPLTGKATVQSNVGNGWLKGNLENFQIELAGDQPLPFAPKYTIIAKLRASATIQNMTIKSFDIYEHNTKGKSDKSSTNIHAKAKLTWVPKLTWQTEIGSKNINPGRLFKDWQGNISASITNRGNVENNILKINTTLNKLSGSLRGYPVSGNGALYWDENKINITALKFNSANSKIKIHGQISSKLNIKWDVSSNNLEELYPKTKGTLYSSGYILGNQDSPLLHATITAKNIQFKDYKVKHFKSNLGIALFNWKKVNIDISADELSYGDYTISNFNITGNHSRITATLNSNLLKAKTTIIGLSSKNLWHGHISQIDITSKELNNWSLVTPTKFSIKNKDFNLNKLCLSSNKSQLCANLQHQSNEWVSNIRLTKIPLNTLHSWLPEDMKLNSKLDASAKIKFKTSENLSINSQLALTAGTIDYPLLEGKIEKQHFQSASASLKLINQRLSATANVTISPEDKLQAQFKLDNINTTQNKLSAKLKLNMHDLSIFETLYPNVQDLTGNFDLSLMASGTLAQPKITSNVQMRNANFKLPYLGLHISNINFSGGNKKSNTLNFKLTAQSGDGKVLIKGITELDFNNGWPTTMTLTGSNVDVANIPIAHVKISPNLKLSLRHKIINITGEIKLPYAKLQPTDFSQAAQVSSDVVIGKQYKHDQKKWLVTTRAKLILGKDVNFSGFGFNGQLGGALEIQDDPNQPSKALGKIDVIGGQYRAYGQQLDIEQGHFLFTGGPLSNPGLDLRAVRKTGEISAGLKIRGSLYYPKVEIFSIPVMSQTNALSYILLGRPIEESSNDESNMMSQAALLLSLSSGNIIARSIGSSFGLDEMRIDSSKGGDQASLVIGRYLSPKLYVSYGVGLIESVNTFKLRYQISDRWQLIGENGEQQGADFLYTFNK